MIVADKFLPLLNKYDPDALDRQTDAIYGLWPDAATAFLKQGWFRFAKDNSGIDIDRWSLGASILTAIPDLLIPFYKTRYSQVLRGAPYPTKCFAQAATRSGADKSFP